MSYIDEILKIIQDSKEILVITGTNASIDEDIAALILANVLQQISDTKSISFKFDKTKFSQINFIDDLLKNIGIVKDDIPSNFVFEIQNADNKIKNIEWKREDEKINFYITTKNSKEINKNDLRFIKKSREIDLIFTIGISSYDQIGSLYKNNSIIFEKANIISIKRDEIESNIKGSKIVDNKASSYSEIVFEISQRLKINLNKSEVDMLLLGIYSATDNYRKIVNPKTFSISSNLLALNADSKFANKYKVLLQNKSVNKEDLFVEINSQSIDQKKKTVAKKARLENDKNLEVRNDKNSTEKVSKKKETPRTESNGINLSTKENQNDEIENNNLQIPLQKASAIPSISLDPNTQPNFIAPPPINPVRPNTFNMPLNPKLR